MGVDHLGTGGVEQQIARLWGAIRQVSVATLQNGAIGRAGLRVYDGGWIRIESGGLAVTGTESVSGRLEGSGVFDWSGAAWLRGSVMVPGNLTGVGILLWSGPWEMRGNGDLTGDVGLDGDLFVRNGRIVAGPLIIDRAGAYGGRVYSSGTLLLDGGTNVVAGAPFQALAGIASIGDITAIGNLSVTGDVGGFTKSFWIDHPSKPGKNLRHGSLEGPEHGVYYRGVVEFDSAGEAVFELPDYFTALVIEDDVPTVQVTSIGKPFLTGAERVVGGRVTIYGDPGREAHVTVTAARGLFDVEPDKSEAQ